MLSVATQYKMHTERLITVRMPNGQINHRGKLISDIDSHNFLYCGGLPPTACVISHYARSVLVVLLRMNLTISCMSTYPSMPVNDCLTSINCSLMCVLLISLSPHHRCCCCVPRTPINVVHQCREPVKVPTSRTYTDTQWSNYSMRGP